MNGVILRILAVGVCVAVGHALQCYKCDIGFWNLCLTTETSCNAGELCFSGDGKTAGFVDIKMKGCLEVVKCNQTHDVNFPASSNTSVYTMTKTCCDTNLCNSAPSLSRMTPLAIATLTSMLMVKVLV